MPVTMTSTDLPEWNRFLDEVAGVMKTKPTINGAVNRFDEAKISIDVEYIDKVVAGGGDAKLAIIEVIERTQALGASVRLREEDLFPFQNYPKYDELCKLAREGAKPVCKPDFVPNNGEGEGLRPQFFRLEASVVHQFEKLQALGRVVILPRRLLDLITGWHLNQSHVVLKEADEKGRICVDSRASGLNEGTDMEAIERELGELRLPIVSEVATLAVKVRKRKNPVLAKYDVEAAFHRFKLFWALALLLCVDLGEYVLIPLVGMFGWNGSPAHYNVISKAIDWAHTGGLSGREIDELSMLLGKEPVHREEVWCDPERWSERSSTYVDDTAVVSPEDCYEMDGSDLKVIVIYLLGWSAIKDEKTVGPAIRLDVIGWTIDLVRGTIAPSHKGMCKMLYYIFRVAIGSVSLKTLESMIGTLQHYAGVLPLVMGTLGCLRSQLKAAQECVVPPKCVNLNADSMREVALWRGMLEACLANRELWCCPLAFMQKRPESDFSVTMFSDASYTIGGGYVIPGVAFAGWKWSEEERELFEKIKQHINILELMVVVVAVWSNVELFKNKTVIVYVDNTSALSWINAMRSNSPLAQPWLRLLYLLCVTFNIHIFAIHIPGVDNVIADALSRDVQEAMRSLVRQGLRRVPSMQLEYRRKIFQSSSGSVGLVEHWKMIQDILIAQGVEPLQAFVLTIISALTLSKRRR
jgi:hypothetical protein